MKYKLLLLVTLISLSTIAQKNSKELIKANKQINTNGEVYFKFDIASKKEIKDLPRFILIDHKTKHTKKTIYAYVHKTRYQELLDLNIPFEVVSKGVNTKALTMATTVAQMANWDRYPTYEVYIQMMENFATNYPSICRLQTIGDSQTGRLVQVLKITDNPDDDENEPEFLYTGQMHGDELVASIMLLRLIDHLLTNYGSDSQVDNLIDNVEIWINPLANPDGCYHGGNNTVSGATRTLQNGVDPNRNFEAPGEPHPDGNPYAKEVIDMMAFADAHDFVLSSNLHSGAEVVNYPWDMWDSSTNTHADDNWWQLVSYEYANTVFANSSGSYFTDVSADGVTEGGDWYVVWGGRQDYMTALKNEREFTLELSGEKFLDATQLPAHWNYNYNSFLKYMEQSLYGIRGLVTDSVTGEPIEAKIEVVGHDDDNSFVYSSLPIGNYHRLIYEGDYDITISAPCYVSQTIANVSVTNFESTLLDVQLVSTGFASEFESNETLIQLGDSVDFTEVSCGNPTSWNWVFEGGTPNTSTDQNPTDITYNEIGLFDVTLTVSDGTNTDVLTKVDYISVNNEYEMENATKTTCQGVFYDSGANSDNYQNNEDYVMTFIPTTSTGKIICEFISFNVEDDSDCGYDWLKVYDGDTISATLIGTYCGANLPATITATNATGALTFEFHSDNTINKTGWKIQLSCDDPSASVEDFSINHIKLIPNPAKDKLKIQTNKKIVSIELININGASIFKNYTNANKEVTINIENIPTGVYAVKVMTKSGVYSLKLIKE